MHKRTIIIALSGLGTILIAGAITTLFLMSTPRHDVQPVAKRPKQVAIVQQNGVTMTIASPTDHQQIDATVPVRLTLTGDTSKATQVQYQIDGKTVATSTKSPFTVDIPVASLTTGSHILQVIVQDKYGAVIVSHQITIVIQHAAAPSSKNAASAPVSSPSPASSAPAPVVVANNPLGSLARIPWEGGPSYWAQFPISVAAGWTSPNFFPLVIWYNSISTDNEVQFDKSYGINSYIGMDGATPYSLFADNGMFWLGGQLNAGFPMSGTAWAGDFLDDEIDGTAPTVPQAVITQQSQLAASGNDGRFKEYNFTQIVTGDYGPTNNAASIQLINNYKGPVSIDAYWYTMPDCVAVINWLSVNTDPGHCRTSSSYGATMRALRNRNVAGGPPKPLWNFIENYSGDPSNATTYIYISPAQLKGAVMDSLINEARGILYFNQNLAGPCITGAVLRSYQQQGATACGAAQMEAMKQVDLQIQALAPVLNTQSYVYSFGSNLDTMLKWYSGSAYIFAMVSGDASSQPGDRSFTLPSGLAGVSSVTVLNEGRTIPVSGGVFHDTFGSESTYHIYQVTP